MASRYPLDWPGRYALVRSELDAAGDKRFYFLPHTAKAAFEVGHLDEAQQLAQEGLDIAGRIGHDWNRGNATHDCHMVLGRVALRRGDVETAKRELLEAGKTEGSPQLNSFGPNMSLAKDLLEQDEVDVVLEYFTLCSSFWEMEDGALDDWSAVAKAGGMPDFRANLIY